MEKHEPKKSSVPDVVECLCKGKIPQKDILTHAKQCLNCKAALGTLSEVLDNLLKGAKDKEINKFLYHLFGHVRRTCKARAKGDSFVPVPPIQNPIVPRVQSVPPKPVQMVAADSVIINPNAGQKVTYASVPVPAPVPVHVFEPFHPPVPPHGHAEEDKKKEDYGCGMYLDDSVFCKLCSTRFVDLKEIRYLERCLHPFCKNDLKKLAFT